MTQQQNIIKRLRKGWCTGLQAVYDCGTLKLSSRVSDLRASGHKVIDKWVEQNGKKFKAYRLVK